MAALPYMKLYPGDYFADTRHLTCLQHGAYLQLMMSYWTNGGPLPNDDKVLARLCGLGPREWQRVKPDILAFFTVTEQQIVSKRLERELHGAATKSLKAKEARATGVKRTSDERSTHHSHSHSQIPSDASHPSVLEPDKSGSPAPASAGEGLPDLFGDDPPAGEILIGDHYTAPFEKWWGEYPNKVGKRKAAKSYEAAFKRVGGAKAGTAKVHEFLLTRLAAQCRVWRRNGVDRQFIPNPATWLGQSRYDDPAVAKEWLGPLALPEVVGDEHLSPAAEPPKRDGKLKLQPVGWKVEDDDG